jgi:hypothetical protein
MSYNEFAISALKYIFFNLTLKITIKFWILIQLKYKTTSWLHGMDD